MSIIEKEDEKILTGNDKIDITKKKDIRLPSVRIKNPPPKELEIDVKFNEWFLTIDPDTKEMFISVYTKDNIVRLNFDETLYNTIKMGMEDGTYESPQNS